MNGLSDLLKTVGCAGLIAAAVGYAAPTTGKVVISEFRTRGPAGGNDEFIELFNAGDAAVNISGYKVLGSSSTGATSPRAVIPSGTVLPPRSFYLLVNSNSGGYSGTVPGDQTYSTGIADNGGIALADPDANIVDAVGMSSGSAYKEGTVLAQTTSNKEQSYERKTATCGPDQDTDDNASDFQYLDGTSTPMNSASCRPACAGDPCVNAPAPECVDAGTSRVYGNGACDAGTCTYSFEDSICLFGCDAATGLCNPDPCAGVVCDTPPNDQCFDPAGTCVNGQCVYDSLAAGTPCEDGDLCTENDQCDGSGTCAGVAVVCIPPAPECRLDNTVSRVYSGGVCNPATGTCEFDFEDTTCAYGCDPASGYCADDPCAGVVCNTPPNTKCFEATGSCSGGSCVYTAFAVGTPCEDGDACTVSDQCNEGHECVGSAMVCEEPPNTECFEGTGVCVAGVCEYTALATGTPCDDQDLCTEADACAEDHGCRGVPKVCEGPVATCTGPDESHVEVDPACDPTDGACRGSGHDVACAGLGCDDAFGTCNLGPIVSQFRTRGPAGGNDEFIELFNAGSVAVDIGGWQVWGSSATGTTSKRATIPAGTVLAPRTFYLLVNSGANGYSGTVAGDLTYSTGISDTGGLALLNAQGAVVDAVGMSSGSAYAEGTALGPMTVNQDQAYERKTIACGPDRDLNDNASDFASLTASHPRNSHSCRLACAGDPCVNAPAPSCVDATTLNTYPSGTCTDQGFCEYPLVPVACEFGCDAGQCNPDPCAGVVCDTPPNDQCYDPAGTCVDGQCVYDPFETGTDCEDGDLCTVSDICRADHTCAGHAVVCEPKAPECADANTSVSYAPGVCNPGSGDCEYQQTETTCDFGCDALSGLCVGDPCAGVVCNTPPSSCHEPVGTCSGGTCSYALKAAGSACDDGDACTSGDACDAGGDCVGTAIICDRPPGPCHDPQGQCSEGTCVYSALAAGTPCDDGDACTLDDQCDGAGLCVGTPDPSCTPAEGTPDLADLGPMPDTGVPDLGPAEDTGTPPEPSGNDAIGPTDVSGAKDAYEFGTVHLDTAGLDPGGADLGPTSGVRGGGGCSASAAVPATPAAWFALFGIGLGALFLRRRD